MKKEIITKKKKIVLSISLFGILLTSILFINLISAQSYSRSVAGYTQYTGIQHSVGDTYFPWMYGADMSFDRRLCEAGQDFILYVSPTGCIPSVVRSDLLEEQNVPVFCPIMATKLNPLIDVEAIDYVSFRGDTPKEVSGLGYYPAQAALGKIGLQTTSSLANTIGYAVIVLKQERNESAMPDFVEGNITAMIKYDIKNAFGVGDASFYLNEMSHSEWNENFKRYGFWKGRGYLRVDSVEDNRAIISIYSDREAHSLARTDKRVIATVPLDVGQTSREILMPGFDYCMGGLQLRLSAIENPGTMTKLNINGDYVDLKKGEKFIDEKCYIRDIDKRGVTEITSITCREDTRANTFSLTINPKIVLNIDGVPKEYGFGDKLYEEIEDGKPTGKSVYLVYARTNKDSRKGDDLIITIAAIPGIEEKLSDARVVSLGKFLNRYPDPEKSQKEEGFLNKIKNIFITGISEIERIFIRGLVTGEAFRNINVSQLETKHFGKNIKLVGFAGAKNDDFSQYALQFKEYYDKAMRDYQTILDNYYNEKYPLEEQITLGQKALEGIIDLAKGANQMRTLLELCENFEEKYPNFDAPDVCQDDTQISSLDFSARDVEISGKIYSISMVRIQEPSFENLGVTVDIGGTSADFIGSRNMSLNDRVEINTSEYITLIGVERDYAIFDISGVKRTTTASTIRINLNSYEVVGTNNYRIGVTKINLNKVAKVSVIPNIKRQTTNATFSFKIGIEKRAIQLTPEKTKERIEKLNRTINRWENINEKLGTVVKTGKAACLATSTALTVKYFFAHLRGEGIAREMVMRESGGWLEFCEAEKLRTGTSVDSCLLENSDKIDANVNEITQIIQEQNKKYKELQQGITKRTDFLGEDVVDTDALMKRFIDTDTQFKNDLNSITNKIDKIKISGSNVSVSDIITEINSETITLTQAREIQLNAQLLNSGDPMLRAIAKKNLEAGLGDVWVNMQQAVERNTFASTYAAGGAATFISTSKEKMTEIYITEDKTFSQLTGLSGNVPSNSLVHLVKNRDDAQEYLLVLDNDHVVKETYKIGQGGQLNLETSINPLQISIKKFDRTTYQNPSTTMVLRYYESGNYQGVPAIVPFDTENGWYAAIKPSVPILGAIKPVDDSGRVSSFWLCNVGPNKKEEFFEVIDFGRGDDICQMINRATGQPYDQFPGLEPSEALRLVNNAQIAISQAQRAYRATGMSSKISILGKSISLGEPAYGVPDLQCQDLWSPKDCNLMFNICDPFVCPSSRCNLGGAYTVRDVIQSGVAGSIALCLPNFPEVIIPICVSGVHAGIDGYLSVMKSYQECLGTSLQTGQTVGVCDHLHSIYMCEFFWRQTLPVAKYLAPKLINKIVGQDVRGGGEYLGAKDAWERAGQSVDYFTQYYAANSYKAFKARSLEGVGTEVCKNWLSIPGLGDGKLFDALTSPDSPFQFYGSFQEIPFTTATVPPISHYKVFYHVYAGKDLPAYYEVYLRGDVGYFYQDVSSRRLVDRGFIAAGERASNTKDFTAPSGYKELCIVVNNQEECGFKQVSTDFAVQYISDSYVAQQAKQTDIKSSTECISGTPSLLSLLNPNLQAGATEWINPAIYNAGLVRICATDNPGKTTDPYAGTEKARWQPVGYCDTPAIKCWLDTKSVKDSIDIGTIENKTLSEVSGNYLDILKKELGYVDNFDELVKEIESEKNSLKQIEKVNENFEKVFYSYEKAQLLFLRGDAFKRLALLAASLKITIVEPKEEVPPIEPPKEPEVCPIPTPTEAVLALSDSRQRVIRTVEELQGKSAPGDYCFHSIEFVYKSAGVNFVCAYSDKTGQQYYINNTLIKIGENKNEKGEIIFQVPTQDTSCEVPLGVLNYEQKLNVIEPGDWLDIVYTDKSSHAVIFISWIDKEKGYARVFDWIGGGSRTYGYQNLYLTQSKNPVYLIRGPVLA